MATVASAWSHPSDEQAAALAEDLATRSKTDLVGPLGNRSGRYGDAAEWFDALFDDANQLSTLEASSLDAIFKTAGVQAVLDCACGTGIQALGLAELGYDVCASDISTRMLRQLRDKAAERRLAIPSRRQDFRFLSRWPGRKFDAVICCGASVTLVPRREEMAASLARMVAVVSGNGGLVVVGLHNYPLLRRRQEEFKLRRPYTTRTGDLAFDVRRFGDDSVELVHTIARLEASGWRLTTSRIRHWYLTGSELHAELIRAGCSTVRLLDVTASREVEDEEWILAVGETAAGS
jgi:SAM-dependent methyltransferase